MRIGDLLALVKPEDLIKYGMIPEFSGRLPVIATLHDLSREDLCRILIEPKNALTRQYQRLFQMEKVKLDFQEETIDAVADRAIAFDTGARGLRAILEEAMLDLMFDIPSRSDIREVIITPGVVLEGEDPIIVYERDKRKEMQDKRADSA